MKINSKDFRVRPGEKVKLREWPTIVKPFCKSKKRYQKLLGEHVEELSSLQRLHYAFNRYAFLLIFQGMDAAGIVLTQPGLGGIVASVKEGRVTFQRILTYALNSVTKKTVQVLFLAVGLVMTGHAILTPMLMVIIMLTGDLLGMSLTTDNVRPSPMPNAWRIGELTIAGVFMGVSELVFCTAVLAIAKFRLGLGIETLRTLAFVVIVFGNQATTYTNRERRRLGSSRPSRWLLGSSVVDLLIASTLATCGIAMTPLPIFVVGGILVAAAVFAFLLDFAKVPVFKRLRIA